MEGAPTVNAKAKAKESRQQLHARICELEHEVGELEDERDAIRRKKSEHRQARRAAEEARDDAIARADRLQDDVDNLELQCEQKRETCSAYKRKLERKRNKLDDARTCYQRARKELDEFNALGEWLETNCREEKRPGDYEGVIFRNEGYDAITAYVERTRVFIALASEETAKRRKRDEDNEQVN